MSTISITDIRLCRFVFWCGYWLQVGISHFDYQKATFQGGLKCGKSAAPDTVAAEVCPSTTLILLGKFLYTSLIRRAFRRRHYIGVSCQSPHLSTDQDLLGQPV